jgi:very-short-patch-repair endonuclease
LDLYFPKYKIIIECDENGHADRHPEKEKEREDFVNQELGTTSANWVRFNPDDPFYDVAKVMGQIHLRMVNSQSDDVKLCCTCRKEKKITEFYCNKNAPDGRERRCKDCRSSHRQRIQLAKEQVGIITPDEKHCLQCNTTKPKAQFWKNSNRKDWLNNLCIDCAKIEKNKHKLNTNKIIPEFKVCFECKQSKKTLECFGKRSSSIDGHVGKCKECSNKRLMEYRLKRKSISRKCSSCKKLQSPTNFSKVTRGLSTICDDCKGVKSGYKLCTGCNVVQSIESYYKRSQSVDGLNGRCIVCIKS